MGKPERPTNIDELIVRTKAGDPSARDALLLYAQAYLRWKAGFEKATASRGKSDLGQDAMERALKAIVTVPVSTADKSYFNLFQRSCRSSRRCQKLDAYAPLRGRTNESVAQ